MHLKTIVSSKGQVVIPKHLREKMGLHAGSEMIISLKDNILEFKPVYKNLKDFFGKGSSHNSQKDTMDVDHLIAQAILEHDE